MNNMCIIVYKPTNVSMPKEETLRECFNRNPDGAGYMYVYNHKVNIKKGFMKFNDFIKSLKKDIRLTTEKVPYVLHFRISTQANGRPDCTHPYPLSMNMNDLRKLSSSSEIGIAHNGIIDLTSASYGYKGTITYNDTMLFITDYLSLIIKNKNYYKDKDTMTLIERLCESKLAILDNDGHCELIGNFIEDNGIYYSNSSYIPKPKVDIKEINKFNDYGYYGYYNSHKDYDYYDRLNEYYEGYYDKEKEKYDFEPNNCPYVIDDDWTFCSKCSKYKECFVNEDEID